MLPARPSITADRTDARRFGLALCAIVTAAFLARLIYLYQIDGLPFFYHPIGDAKSYWDWSGRIAGGDWMGDEAFYQAPGYPYFLAVARILVGHDLWRVRVVQIALGSVACGLLALAGRRLFCDRAGLWTGAIMACYGPAIFYDGLIQKAGLSFFLMAAVLWLMAELGIRTGPLRRTHATPSFECVSALALAGGLGLMMGFLAITVEQALLLVPVVVGSVLVSPRTDRELERGCGSNSNAQRGPSLHDDGGGKPRRSLRAGAILLGCGVVLGAVAWRNHHVAGVWAITTVQAGPNFYIGNHAGATGRYVPLVPGHETPEFERRDAVELAEAAAGRPLTPTEVSDYWSGRAWAWIRADLGGWVRLMGAKWLLVWNAYEIPDTECYTLYRDFSWVLGLLGRVNHFGVLCPLAVVGLIGTARSWRRLWPLYAMMLAISGGVAAFYVFGRYRFPLVPLLAVIAGCGSATVYDWIRHRIGHGVATDDADGGSAHEGEPPPSLHKERGGKPRGSLPRGTPVVLVLAAAACNVPVNPERELDALAYANLGAILGQQGNYDGAIYCLERALEGSPESVDARFNLGMALRLKGDRQRALEEFKRVRSADRERIEVNYQLGSLYEELGETDLAVIHYERALEIDPDDADARAALNRLLTAKTPSTPRE